MSDRLANVIWNVEPPEPEDFHYYTADAIRAALADGSLLWRDVLPPEVGAVYDAAVACRDDWRGRSIGRMLAAVDALPERGTPTDDALCCAWCGAPIAGEPHTDSDGEDVHGDCCAACHPEREG